MFNTTSWWRALLLLALLYLSACGKSAPPESVTLILKKDGSQFTGTVVRRETNSITLTGVGGETHTFLWTEISKISKPNAPGDETKDGGGPTSGTGSSSARVRADLVIPADGVIQFPAGTEFPVSSDGFIDSCCAPTNLTVVGILDKDIRNNQGQVVIPEGTTFAIILAEAKNVDGRLVMTFALASAEFGGRHYRISATTGNTETGALVSFSGAKSNTPEARTRGVNIHLDDHTFMGFKAINPVIFKAE